MLRVAVVAIGMVLVASPAIAAPALNDEVQAISASFVCPDALPDDAAREDMREGLGRRLASLHLSLPQAQRVVDMLMTVHGCAPLRTTQLVNATR